MPPEHLRFATGFPPQPKIAVPKESRCAPCIRIKSTVKLMVLLRLPAEIRTRGYEDDHHSIFCEWASIFNDYSSPFSWGTAGTVNSVTGYGTPCRSGVGNPAESPYPGAEILVRLRHVDNWEGWNEQQVQFLLESNPNGTERSLRRPPSRPPGFSIKDSS